MYKKCEEKEKKILKGFDCKGVHAQCKLAKKTRTFPGLLSSEYNNQGVSFHSWYLFLLLLFVFEFLSVLHNTLVSLLQVKPECPLCKQPFKSIIHNVKSYNNYDQFYLDHHPSAPHQPMRFGWNLDRSFRYRTTLTMDHRYVSVHVPPLPPSRPMLHPDLAQQQRRGYYESRPYHMRLRSRTGRLQRTTTHFRREIYATGRRVSRVDRMTRMRTVSPWFFRSNPAQTHRLVPWLNRELNALLHEAEGQVRYIFLYWFL